MNAPNSNRHPLDKYIGDRMDQLDVKYNPSDWKSVQSMMLSNKEITNPNNSFSFSKLTSYKIIAVTAIFVVVLTFVFYHLIGSEDIEKTNLSRGKNQPIFQQNMIDSTDQYNQLDQKINSVPNLIPKLKQKENLDLDFYQLPLNSDSILGVEVIDKQIIIDSIQIKKSIDTIDVKKKKHILW